MQTSSFSYAAGAAKLLIWIGGIVTTIAGSWIASRIRVYEDSRNNHREELKQKVLEPLQEVLKNQFVDPSFSVEWDEQRYDPTVRAHEQPVTMGPVLFVSDPGLTASVLCEPALAEDARQNHHKELMTGARGAKSRQKWE
jgi:hypothetical protein